MFRSSFLVNFYDEILHLDGIIAFANDCRLLNHNKPMSIFNALPVVEGDCAETRVSPFLGRFVFHLFGLGILNRFSAIAKAQYKFVTLFSMPFITKRKSLKITTKKCLINSANWRAFYWFL